MFVNVQCQQYDPIIRLYATGIDQDFITSILTDPKNQCLLYTNDVERATTSASTPDHSIGFIVYRITKTAVETRVYILLLAVHCEYQSCGYGSLMLKDLFEQSPDILNLKQHKKLVTSQTCVRFVIHSTRNNVRFYYNNGFRRTRTNCLYRTIYKYEAYCQNDVIMTFRVTYNV